jgi:hypothetical protein
MPTSSPTSIRGVRERQRRPYVQKKVKSRTGTPLHSASALEKLLAAGPLSAAYGPRTTTVLAIGKLSAPQANYYLDRAEARVDTVQSVGGGLEDYYSEGKAARGRWLAHDELIRRAHETT